MSSVEPQDRASELDGGQECVGQFVVAGGDGAEVFEFVEEPFNEVALAIQSKVCIARFDPIGLRRNDRHDPPSLKGANQGVGIIGFISQKRLGFDRLQQRFCLTDVRGLPRRERQGDRIAQRVDDGVDLGGQSTARAPDGLILPLFFCAPALC